MRQSLKVGVRTEHNDNVWTDSRRADGWLRCNLTPSEYTRRETLSSSAGTQMILTSCYERQLTVSTASSAYYEASTGMIVLQALTMLRWISDAVLAPPCPSPRILKFKRAPTCWNTALQCLYTNWENVWVGEVCRMFAFHMLFWSPWQWFCPVWSSLSQRSHSLHRLYWSLVHLSYSIKLGWMFSHRGRSL